MLCCSRCKQDKPDEAYAPYQQRKQHRCRECQKEVYQKDKPRAIAHAKQWQADNPERYRVNISRYQKEHKEEIKARHKEYLKNNPTIWKQFRQKRRALERSNGPVDYIKVGELYNRDDGVCQICFTPVELTVTGNYGPSIDHRVPIFHGGTHTWDNVQLAHLICNIRKGTKLPEEFKQEVSSWP